jgi:hypothetical protein
MPTGVSDQMMMITENRSDIPNVIIAVDDRMPWVASLDFSKHIHATGTRRWSGAGHA